MKVSRSEFDRAASGVVSPGQAEALWGALLEGANVRPRFDLPNVAYYFGALGVVSAMGWFISDAWERFGGWGSSPSPWLTPGSSSWRATRPARVNRARAKTSPRECPPLPPEHPVNPG
jgi:hypothetical protein